MKLRRTSKAKTMDDIARLAGVSKPTVSRALNDSPLVLQETKQRVLEVARRYGYAVNRNAQKLREKRTNTIAVVIDFPSLPDHRLSDPFHFELLGNLANALTVRNQDILLYSPKIGDEAQMYQTMLSSKRADGIIFIGQGGRLPILRELGKTHAPFVVWGARVEGSNYCVVGSDNFRGGELAGKRFASLGRRRVVFLGPPGHPEIDLRRAGLAQGVGSGKIEIHDLRLTALSYQSSLDATRAYLANHKVRPDAIFGASDTIAMAAIAAFREHGLRTPEDFSAVGYDDSVQAVHHAPPLTTIRQDTWLAGALLVEKLIQMLDEGRPKSVLLPTDLIVRAT